MVRIGCSCGIVVAEEDTDLPNNEMDLNKYKISAKTLKWIAVIAMLLDHGATVLLGRWLIAHGVASMIDPTALGTPLIVYRLCRCVGRLAFPLYGFLLYEGVTHTSNRLRYMLRIACMAIVSEIPYDLVYYDTLLSFDGQNVFFTLLIGLLVMMAADAAKRRFGARDWRHFLCFGSSLLLGMFAAQYGKTDFLALGVLMLGLFYLLQEFTSPAYAVLGGTAALAVLSFAGNQFCGCLAALPVALYGGKRGRGGTRFFYLFYPVHLLLLYLLIKILPFG